MLQQAPVLIHVHLHSWLGLMTSEPKGLTTKSSHRRKLSKIGLAVLFTDYRTTSNESMLAKYSHLLPIQPSRASNLLPLLLGVTCSQTRRVTPTISTTVIDFLPINQGRLNFYRFCPFQGILQTLWKVVMPFIREKFSFGFNIFFNGHQTCISKN